MKFLFALKKNDKYLLKMVLDDGKEKWAETTEAVVSFAKKNFNKEEVCEFEYKVDAGRYTVSKISKVGGKPSTTNQKAPVNKPADKAQVLPTINGEVTKRLAVLKASTNAIMLLQGQVDSVDTIGDMIVTLYNKLYKIVS